MCVQTHLAQVSVIPRMSATATVSTSVVAAVAAGLALESLRAWTGRGNESTAQPAPLPVTEGTPSTKIGASDFALAVRTIAQSKDLCPPITPCEVCSEQASALTPLSVSLAFASLCGWTALSTYAGWWLRGPSAKRRRPDTLIEEKEEDGAEDIVDDDQLARDRMAAARERARAL